MESAYRRAWHGVSPINTNYYCSSPRGARRCRLVYHLILHSLPFGHFFQKAENVNEIPTCLAEGVVM